MNRLMTMILGGSQTPEAPPSDRDHGLGTCRWCLNIVALKPAGWVHLATGHATCLDPPMGAPLTCAAQPLPPAPQRWNLLFPTDTRRARIAWTLGIIGATGVIPPPSIGGRPASPRPWFDTNAQPAARRQRLDPLPPGRRRNTS
jgi:hypothetical protein